VAVKRTPRGVAARTAAVLRRCVTHVSVSPARASQVTRPFVAGALLGIAPRFALWHCASARPALHSEPCTIGAQPQGLICGFLGACLVAAHSLWFWRIWRCLGRWNGTSATDEKQSFDHGLPVGAGWPPAPVSGEKPFGHGCVSRDQ